MWELYSSLRPGKFVRPRPWVSSDFKQFLWQDNEGALDFSTLLCWVLENSRSSNCNKTGEIVQAPMVIWLPFNQDRGVIFHSAWTYIFTRQNRRPSSGMNQLGWDTGRPVQRPRWWWCACNECDITVCLQTNSGCRWRPSSNACSLLVETFDWPLPVARHTLFQHDIRLSGPEQGCASRPARKQW